jgi:hypothetical protein
MNRLEFNHLLKLCEKHGIDSYEIDSSISYAENKKHIQALITAPELDMKKWGSVEEQYIHEHPLWDYITNSPRRRQRKTVPPQPEGFSLRDYCTRLKRAKPPFLSVQILG